MNTIEGNKLIADFMGYETCTDPDHENDKCYQVPYAKGYHRAKQLQHHTSWDWLMPVVERIEDTKIKRVSNPQVDIIIGDCYISNIDGDFDFIEIGNDKIQSVWRAVIQFIQWYQTKQ